MNFQAISSQRKFILIASVIGVISVFLPWVTISILGETEGVNGFRGAGIVVFLAFAAGIVISLTGDQSTKLDRSMWIAALAVGAIAFLFTVISFGSTDEGMGFVEAGHGIGIWLALICSLGILAAAWLLKNPGDSLRTGIEGLKQNRFTTGSPSNPNKMDELERLIELRNQGKITEDEYRERKAKLL